MISIVPSPHSLFAVGEFSCIVGARIARPI